MAKMENKLTCSLFKITNNDIIKFEAIPLFEGDRLLDWQIFHIPKEILIKGIDTSEFLTEEFDANNVKNLFKKYSKLKKSKPPINEYEACGTKFIGSLSNTDYYVSKLNGNKGLEFEFWEPGKRKSLSLYNEDLPILLKVIKKG